MNTENFASLIKVHAPNDCVRKFRVGNDDRAPDLDKGGTDDNGGRTVSNLHPSNVWPDPALWEDARPFRASITSYYDGMRAVGAKILAMILASMRRHGHVENADRIASSNNEVRLFLVYFSRYCLYF